ncbi:MAG: tail fiber protein [Myxococcales bacterium]|nr:tail fiber protein [Myxococcales bacterium]
MATNPPIGTIIAYAGPVSSNWESTNGWLICDGRPLDRTKADGPDGTGAPYMVLFNAIGSSWGGDGVNSFNIPDLRGRFLRGVDGGMHRDDDSGGRLACNPGGHTGDQVGTIQHDQVGRHDHPVNDPGHSHAVTAFDESGQGGFGAAFPRDPRGYQTNPSTTGITVGANATSETRPRNGSVHWLIRYK